MISSWITEINCDYGTWTKTTEDRVSCAFILYSEYPGMLRHAVSNMCSSVTVCLKFGTTRLQLAFDWLTTLTAIVTPRAQANEHL
jgi:hypothetical protein